MNYVSLIKFFSNYMLMLPKEISANTYKEKVENFLLKSPLIPMEKLILTSFSMLITLIGLFCHCFYKNDFLLCVCVYTSL